MNIKEILQSKKHNPHYLNRYIAFINACKRTEKRGYCEIHHICPKAKAFFPEYSDLKEHPWNGVKLTAREHFISHIMLAFAYGGGMWAPIYKISKQCNIKITSRRYQYIREKVSEYRTQSGKMRRWFHNPHTGETVHVETCDIEGFIPGRGVTFNKHRIQCYNPVTKDCIYVDSEDMIPSDYVKGSAKNGASLWHNPDTLNTVFVSPEEDPPHGYVKGSPNSASWRYVDVDTQKIFTSKVKDLHLAVPNIKPLASVKDKKYYYNPLTKECKPFHPEDVPQGWLAGNINQLGIKRTANKKWYKDPETGKTKMFLPGSQPNGWTPGRT